MNTIFKKDLFKTLIDIFTVFSVCNLGSTNYNFCIFNMSVILIKLFFFNRIMVKRK